MSVAYPLRVYFDQSCPLCATEMLALKKYDRQARIELVDCSIGGFQDPLAQQAGFTKKDFMTLIHARDNNGRWLQGVAVFEATYAAVGMASVARVWANPWLRPLWDWLYPHVARHRMLLSKLGASRLFGWLVARAARNAAARALVCVDTPCARNARNARNVRNACEPRSPLPRDQGG